MEELLQTITPLLMTVLTALVGYLGLKVKEWIDTKITQEQQEQLLKFINSTVEYVEQIGYNLDGEKKFNLAKVKVLTWINDRNVPVSEEELDILIESAVFWLPRTETEEK